MKSRFLELIDLISRIEKLFHDSPNSTAIYGSQLRVIYDVQEFKNWIAEVTLEIQDIVDRTGDSFAKDTLDYIKSSRFNGWHDTIYFENIKGKLMAIRRNIDRYYTGPIQKPVLPPKLFISHSSDDIKYVTELVTLLDDMGLDQTQIFCSSVPGYGIPIDNDIYDYLREEFYKYNLHVIYVLSKKYYKSVPCLNEMGATWVLRYKYTSFLLPGFQFSSMKGAINSNAIAIKLDSNEIALRDNLNQFYDKIVDEFNLKKKSPIIWEQKRDSFICNIKSCINENHSTDHS